MYDTKTNINPLCHIVPSNYMTNAKTEKDVQYY